MPEHKDKVKIAAVMAEKAASSHPPITALGNLIELNQDPIRQDLERKEWAEGTEAYRT